MAARQDVGSFLSQVISRFLNKCPGRQQQRTGGEHLNQAKSATAVVDEQADSTLTQYSTRHESVRGAKGDFRARALKILRFSCKPALRTHTNPAARAQRVAEARVLTPIFW